MSRHIEYSEPGEPTRQTSLEMTNSIPGPWDESYVQPDELLTPRERKTLIAWAKYSLEKHGGDWWFGKECAEKLRRFR